MAHIEKYVTLQFTDEETYNNFKEAYEDGVPFEFPEEGVTTHATIVSEFNGLSSPL